MFGKRMKLYDYFLFVLILCFHFERVAALDNFIHTVKKNQSIEELEKIYKNSLNGQSLLEINSHLTEKKLKKILSKKKGEVIVDHRVAFSFCTYKVKKGEWLVSIIRRYGYKKPYSLDLVSLFNKKNPHIKNLNFLKKDDNIFVPIVYIKQKDLVLRGDESCNHLLAINNKNSFIIKNKKIKEKELYFSLENPTDEKVENLESFKEKISKKKYIVENEILNKEVLIANNKPSTLKKEEQPKGSFSFLLSGVYDSLHGRTGSTSIVVSHLQPKLGLEWKLFWSERWYGFVGMELIFKSYENNTFGDEIVLNREFRQGDVYTGLGYLWDDLSFFNLSLGLSESIFYKQLSENVYSLEGDQNPSLKLKVSQKIWRGNIFSAAGLSQFQYLSEDEDTGFKGGFDYGLGIELRHFMKLSSFGGALLYNQGYFKSKWFEFEHKSLDFIFSYQTEF